MGLVSAIPRQDTCYSIYGAILTFHLMQGIVGNVTYEMRTMTNWQMWSIPLNNVTGIPFQNLTAYVFMT